MAAMAPPLQIAVPKETRATVDPCFLKFHIADPFKRGWERNAAS
jgi:hypothetical protein